jgi:hypothetical protein
VRGTAYNDGVGDEVKNCRAGAQHRKVAGLDLTDCDGEHDRGDDEEGVRVGAQPEGWEVERDGQELDGAARGERAD